MRAGSLVFVAMAWAIVSAACTEETIVLAHVESQDGGVPRLTSTKCLTNDDCVGGAGPLAYAFCNHRGCGASAGTCEPYPLSCESEEHPVCGCDGVTYFNDCLRRISGVPGSEPDECGLRARSCGRSDDPKCPGSSVCARLYAPDAFHCSQRSVGSCWSVPAECPEKTFARSDRWNACFPGPGEVRCIDTCSAIKRDEPFFRAVVCE